MQLLNVNMFLLLVFFATALVSLVTGNPITERTLSYDTDNDTEATFIVTHEGQDYELKGTVQKVIAQMDVLHPGYAANITARVNEDLENHAAIQVELQPRNQVFPPLCIPVTGQDWAGCPYYPDSFNAISTLYRFNQPIHAYPSSCSMISCSGSCGIYLCNDQTNDIYLGAQYLSNYAAHLCTIPPACYNGGPSYNPNSGGQMFDTDQYNVIVHSADCTGSTGPSR